MTDAIQVENLTKYHGRPGSGILAVDRISFFSFLVKRDIGTEVGLARLLVLTTFFAATSVSGTCCAICGAASCTSLPSIAR